MTTHHIAQTGRPQRSSRSSKRLLAAALGFAALAAGTAIATGTAEAATSTLVARGATWRWSTGTDLGTAWRSPTYSDSTWRSGAGQLGYGDGDERTVLPYGSNASNRYPTAYFRTSFSVANPSTVTGLTLTGVFDDGFIAYVNGTQVARVKMPSTTVSYRTLAAGWAENEVVTLAVPASVLRAGTNVLAVEVHQRTLDSSDLSWDASLTATV